MDEVDAFLKQFEVGKPFKERSIGNDEHLIPQRLPQGAIKLADGRYAIPLEGTDNFTIHPPLLYDDVIPKEEIMMMREFKFMMPR
jgi:hypothetical protein